MCTRNKLTGIAVIALFLLMGTGCKEDYIAKPRAYHRITFPEKSYRSYVNEACPFGFQYPTYATIVRDSLFFDEATENSCWLDVVFKDFGGTLHITYKEITPSSNLADYINDAHTLTFKHSRKADFIDESEFANRYGAVGMIYEVGGDAASAVQFYVTDETDHFLRGSLYFNAQPNADSLAPVISFVKDDMLHMLNTFQWKGS